MNEFAAAPILDTNFITIEGFESLTHQELFNRSATHILANGPSWDEALPACRYSGSGCAVAVFIREDLRELADAKFGAWRNGINMRLVPNHEGDLIREMQVAHDATCQAARHETNNSVDRDAFMVQWTHRMRNIAEAYNLNASVLDTAK